MTRLLSLPLTLIALSAMLYTSVTPASACTCGFTTDPEEIRRDFEEFSPLVVEGAIAPDDGTSLMKFAPEIVYWGSAPDVITLDQPWVTPYDPNYYGNLDPLCGYTLSGRPGTRYVLFLSPSPGTPSTYRPSGCASFPMAYVDQAPEGVTRNIYRERYDALQIATGRASAPGAFPAGGGWPDVESRFVRSESAPGQEEAARDEATEDTPWLIVLPLAFAIPLAVLVVPSFIVKRGGGGH